MSVYIEALYIYDDQRNPILEHVYASRPPSASALISQFVKHPAPWPSLLYLPDLAPSTVVFSVSQAGLLLLCPCSSDTESLAVLEFLYKVIDVFEEFLGAPLTSGKIVENYEVIAQLLSEMCDGGLVCNTEPNSLRETVEVSSVLGKLFTQVGLPGASPALGPANNLAAQLKANAVLNSGPAIPWRRPNVRHTSNELYVDMVEKLAVVLAPSGRPISARAAGSISFTAKISGVPDLLLTLAAPGGTSSVKSAGISRTMQLPVFHPCVRLARWKEHPGEISFIPPDGRFMLAGYEVDLLPSQLNVDRAPSSSEKLFLPATVDLRTGLGPSGSDFEARLTLNSNFPGMPSQTKTGLARSAAPNPFSFGSAASGSSNSPTLEALVVTVPFTAAVRSVADIKCSRGEANFNMWDRTIEWKIPTKDGASINGVAILSGSILGPLNPHDNEDTSSEVAERAKANSLLGYYDEDSSLGQAAQSARNSSDQLSNLANQRRVQTNKVLMPRSVMVSFTVRGWLPSGIRVNSLVVDVKKSRGLGEGVKPFKGVKYITVSKRGVERRT